LRGDDGDLGTVASAKAQEAILAPCLMMPAEFLLGAREKNPGTSSKVIKGMLKASQKRTKRCALTEALMSRTPARNAG